MLGLVSSVTQTYFSLYHEVIAPTPKNLLCNLTLADVKRVGNYSYCFQQAEFFQQSFYEE